MKNWIRQFLGLNKLSHEIKEIHNETSELKNVYKSELLQLTSKSEDIIEKIQNSNSEILSNSLIALNAKIEEPVPIKTEFSPSDLKIKDVLGNIVLDFSLKPAEEVDFNKVKRIHGAALFATSTVNLASFHGISQNLFFATANPSSLMALKGGVGSAVMGAKGIVGQAPFISAGLGAFTPILLFQATSMMIMQSSINNLTEIVETVKKKVEILLDHIEKENEATLITINNKLVELDLQKFYTIEDFVLLENYKDKLNILSTKYRLLAIKSSSILTSNPSSPKLYDEETSDVIVNKKLGEKVLGIFDSAKKEVSKLTNYISESETSKFVNENIFERFRNSNGDVNKLNTEIINSKLQYYLVLSSTAETLLSQAQFLELKMNYAQINPDNNRIEKAKYLVEKFKKNHETLSSQNLLLLETIQQNVTEKIISLQNNSDWKREKIEIMKNEITKSLNETKNIIIQNQDEIYVLKNSLNNQQSLDLIVDYRDGQENIYLMN